MNLRHLRLAVLLPTVVLAACSSADTADTTTPGAPATTATSTVAGEPKSSAELVAALDAAAEDGFSCEIAGSTTVAWFPGDGDEMYDSLFASYVDGAGHGLEIVTIDGVSYARWTAGSDDGATNDEPGSPERRALIERLAGAWGSWGQPDTITLEELPTAPSGCMSWAAIDRFENVMRDANGRWTFDATIAEHDGAAASGVMETADGEIESFAVAGGAGGTDPLVTVGFERPAALPATVPAGVVELTQDEYFTLVGG